MALSAATGPLGTESHGDIVGTVGAAQTGAGVADVRIQIVNLDARVVGQVQTDAAGGFDFAGVPAGAYVVREAAVRGRVRGSSFLDGVAVGVGEVDPATGGPYPASDLHYDSNDTDFSAAATGPVVGPGLGASIPAPPSPAVIAFTDRREAIAELVDPGADDANFANIFNSVDFGLTGLLGLVAH